MRAGFFAFEGSLTKLLNNAKVRVTRSEGGRLLGDQRARKIHFIAAAVRGSDKVSWSHAPRNI